jgi:oxygen-independent coproporphyrinogen-3 oxidase
MMRTGVEQLPPLALYVHLPWCVRKCPYCDFNSHRAGEHAPKNRYIRALLRDIDAEARVDYAAGRALASVFLGGGTPSLFSAAHIESILDAAQSAFGFAATVEITMEANPGTVEYGNFADYRAAGVTRLSLGAQSFDAGMLQRLGRIHGPQEIVSAFRGAEAAGFDSINLDLMFALPGQDQEMAAADLKQAIGLSPSHISWYQLTLEPNTVFHSRPPAGLPDDDASWAMQLAGHDLLVQAGYEHYEISAFAKHGHRCRHNLNYWTFGDYLAVGAGAHGKITDRGGAVRRYAKPAHPMTYMEQMEAGLATSPPAALGRGDLSFEYLLNALRLTDGFTESAFSERTGRSLADIAGVLTRARSDGLLMQPEDGTWCPTELGFRFLNDLQARFLGGD